MKKIFLVVLVASTLFIQNNSFAQFNLPKKKGAASKTTNDKVVPTSPSTDAAPVQPLPPPAANNNSTAVNPNNKASKPADTTLS